MNKKNLYLLAIFAVLVLAAYLVQGPIADLSERWGKSDNWLSKVEVDAISHIDIKGGDTGLTLAKQGDRWLIDGTKDFYVKDETMQAALAGLKEAAADDLELVGENQAKMDEFETGTSTGTLLTLRQADTVLAEVVVGKNGPDFMSTYISRPGSSDTYLTDSNLRSQWRRSDWYDREILALDAEAVDYLRFQYPNREFIIQKDEDGWSGTDPYIFNVDEKKVAEVLDVMAGLRAVEIPAQSFEGTGLEKNLIIVQVQGEEIDQTLMVGEADENNNYFVKRADSDNIYLITEEQRYLLDKQIRDLQ